MDQGQTGRFSKDELALIKSTFKEEKVLFALRDHLFQLEMSEEEKKLLSFSEPMMKILRKFLCPAIEKDVPLGQQVDMYLGLMRITEMNPAIGALHIQANDMLIEYVEDQLVSLKHNNEKRIHLLELTKELGSDQQEIRFVNMLAYRMITGFLEARMSELKEIAMKKEETDDEKKKREEMNSSK